jgi:hypothetical protein
VASIAALAARHAVVDARPGQYLCFPDLLALPGGRLLCVYREADRHVATRRALLARESADGGATWGPAREVARGTGHCPRLSAPAPGLVYALDDDGALFASRDAGRTWSAARGTGMAHGVPDRILPLPGGPWLTTAHRHLDGPEDPASGQRPTEQIVFASRDAGSSWRPRGRLAGPGRLVLCEAAMVRLPSGRLLALLRENSHVGEPIRRCHSDDGGRTWSPPEPTPLLGHRPTPGLTTDGRLLVTYRDTGPSPGTSAWLGPEEALRGFAPQGPASHAPGPPPPLSAAGLLLEAPPATAPWLLHPLTAPDAEHAALEAEVRCLEGAAGLRLGGWWRVTPRELALLGPPESGGSGGAHGAPSEVLARTALAPGAWTRIRLEWRPGEVRALVDGAPRLAVALPAADVRRRAVCFGALPGAAGRSLWRAVGQDIRPLGGGPGHAWAWTPAQGQPDARARREVLRLADAPGVAWPDFGYSGWAEPRPGRFVCVYHHAEAQAPDYAPGTDAHVRATRFDATDFPP